MSLQPPRLGRKPPPADPLGVLQHEIAAEQASSLGRAARRLEAALAALDAGAEAERDRLAAEAGDALWHLVVQREAIGLRTTEQLMRDYRVPKAVYLRMGLLPPHR